MKRQSEEARAYLIAEIAESKQAEDIIMVDVSKNSPLADFYVVCSVKSTPQLKAVASEIVNRLSKIGVKPRREGVLDSGWVVLDFGSVIAHVMKAEVRKYYALEQLWSKSAVMYHL